LKKRRLKATSPHLQWDGAEDRIRNVAYSIDFAYITGKPADGTEGVSVVWVWGEDVGLQCVEKR